MLATDEKDTEILISVLIGVHLPKTRTSRGKKLTSYLSVNRLLLKDSKKKVVIARRNDEAIFHASDPGHKDCFAG